MRPSETTCASDEPTIDAVVRAPPNPLRPDEKRRFAAILRHRLAVESASFFDIYEPTGTLDEKESPHVYRGPARRYVSYGHLVVDGVGVSVVVKCMFANEGAEESAWIVEREAIEAEKHAYDCVVANGIDKPFFAYPYVVHTTRVPVVSEVVAGKKSTRANDLATQLRSRGLVVGSDVVLVVMEGERRSPSLRDKLEHIQRSIMSKNDVEGLVAIALQLIVAVNATRGAGIVHGDLHLNNVLLVDRAFYFDLEDGTVSDVSGRNRVKMDTMIRVIDWDKSKMFEGRGDPRDEGYDAVALLKLLTWWFECGLGKEDGATLWNSVVESFHMSTIRLRRHQPLKWLFAAGAYLEDFQKSCAPGVRYDPPWGLQYTKVPEGKTWGEEETRRIWNSVRTLYSLLCRRVFGHKVTAGPLVSPSTTTKWMDLFDAFYVSVRLI